MNRLTETIEALFTKYRIFMLGDVASPKTTAKGKLICIDCGRGIHRHERYTILSARHRDCSDPKLVGQKSLPTIQEATLGD